MNARLERKLRLLGVIVIASIIGAIAYVFAQGYTSFSAVATGISYGVILSLAIGGISQFVLEGPMRMWLGGLSFTANMAVRSAIYAAIIIPTQYFPLGAVMIGQPFVPSGERFPGRDDLFRRIPRRHESGVDQESSASSGRAPS